MHIYFGLNANKVLSTLDKSLSLLTISITDGERTCKYGLCVVPKDPTILKFTIPQLQGRHNIHVTTQVQQNCLDMFLYHRHLVNRGRTSRYIHVFVVIFFRRRSSYRNISGSFIFPMNSTDSRTHLVYNC